MTAKCSRTTTGSMGSAGSNASAGRCGPRARRPPGLHAPDELEHLVVSRDERHDEVVVADPPDLDQPRPGQVPRILVVEDHRQTVQRLELGHRLRAVEDLLIAVGRVVRVVGREAEREVRRARSSISATVGFTGGSSAAWWRLWRKMSNRVAKIRSSAPRIPRRRKLGPRRRRRPRPCARPPPTGSAAGGRRHRGGAEGRATASGASRTSSSRSGCPTPGSSRGRAAARSASDRRPNRPARRISVPVGALASKSRVITASSCSRVSRTEKSRSALKLDGKTRRSWPLTTKGFIAAVPTRAPPPRPADAPPL